MSQAAGGEVKGVKAESRQAVDDKSNRDETGAGGSGDDGSGSSPTEVSR